MKFKTKSGDMAEVHPSITEESIVGWVRRGMSSLDSPGFCLACGVEAGGCEPDARHYTCESCGEPAVFGAEEILLMPFA